ncbi:hypothetical protein J132_09526 [Termitomyces sp. J132]|nr:hypothetical protein J132_09526 [Termitomyces sp. J132]
MQQATRKQFAITRNEWFRQVTLPALQYQGFIIPKRFPIDVYKPGNRLTLAIPKSNQFAEVQIVKAFTPFTNSVALLVNTCSTILPCSFLLKLTDRRAYSYWNPDDEEDYQSKIQSHVSRFGVSIQLDPDEELLPWMYLFQFWERVENSYFKECEAYKRLAEAQTHGLVPRFFGTAKINMLTRSPHPSLNHIRGLMVEYIPGRLMSSLRPGINITIEEAEVISQRILELGRRLRLYGVSHNDVHVGNIILRPETNFPVLIDWGRASFLTADLPLQERWGHPDLRQDFHHDIRTVLKTGVYYRGPNNDSVYPDIPAGGVWHRYRTPVSDEEQIQYAKEAGYGAANCFIQALSSKEELEMLYDEDATIDINCGLRWKVKKGVKTRGFDDPCPVV